jgi:hypothetical protein
LNQLIVEWVNNYLSPSYQNVIIIATSQIIYSVINYRYEKLLIETEISKDNIVYIVSTIMSYKYFTKYTEEYEKKVSDFLNYEKIME